MIVGLNFLEPYFNKLYLALMGPELGLEKTLHELWLAIQALDDTGDFYSGSPTEVFLSLEAAVNLFILRKDIQIHCKKLRNSLT